MNDGFWIIGLLGIWLLLQLVILPKMGIPTWMSGNCSVEFDADKKTTEEEENVWTVFFKEKMLILLHLQMA